VDTNRYRRAYRALVGKLGLSDDERRDLNERLTGHRSSTEFSETHWQDVVAECQRLAGRPGVRRGQPHLKADRPRRRDLPYPLDNGCTPEQALYIRDLAEGIAWRHDDGPDAGLRDLIGLRAFTKAQHTQADQWRRAGGTLESLPRNVASQAIRILHRMIAAAAARRPVAAAD